jgi:hypothetical protein
VPGITQGGLEFQAAASRSTERCSWCSPRITATQNRWAGPSMAASKDDGRTFKVLYELSRDKFINVSFVSQDGWVVSIRQRGLSQKQCLPGAREAFRDRCPLEPEYFSGSAPDGQARWSTREADAETLFQHNVVGELSVSYFAPLAQYLMLYNSREPRGIVMRSAHALRVHGCREVCCSSRREIKADNSCTSPGRTS